VERSWV